MWIKKPGFRQTKLGPTLLKKQTDNHSLASTHLIFIIMPGEDGDFFILDVFPFFRGRVNVFKRLCQKENSPLTPFLGSEN